MMNMIQLQEQLKDFSQDQLINEMRMPSGSVPQYLVLSEMQRRKRMEVAAAGDQGRPQTTVAEDAVAAAGVPQGGIAQMARSLAPQTDMTQNTGQGQSPVTGMSGGGTVRRMENGGLAGISRDVGDYAPSQSEEDWFERWLAGETLTVDNLGVGAYEGAPMVDPGDPRNQPPFRQRGAGANQDGPALPYTALDRILFPNMSEEEIQRRGEERVQRGLPSTTVEQPVDELSGLTGTPEVPAGSNDLADAMLRQRAAEEYYGVSPGMTTGDMLSPDDQLLLTTEEREAAGIETPVAEPETPTSDETGGAGGAGGTSDADRLAEQDRWLTLARFGLGLMSSRSPTFGGAIGEAGTDALDYMQGMEQQRFERDLAERTLAARSAGSGQEGMRPPTGGDLLDRMAQIDESLQSLSMNVIGGETDAFTAEAIARLTAERAQIAATLGFGAPGSGGPTYDVSD